MARRTYCSPYVNVALMRIAKLGPGLVFAASAVGTSHLVQSTRAGADFGLTFVWVIIAITLLKYPVFRFAADYAASTGQSLVTGYAHRGKWLVGLLAVAVLAEGIGAVAGVSLVTAGIAQSVLGTDLPDKPATVGLLIVTALIVMLGRYRVVENITKVFVAIFSLLTLVTALSTLPLLFELPSVAEPFTFAASEIQFAVAVSGWMPIGNVAAFMLAAWVFARAQTESVSLADARTDFNIGYFATLLLALCFVLLGTATLLHSDMVLPAGSVGFADLLLGVFATISGPWIMWVVGITALAVMYSTLLAILDGFPRLLLDLADHLGVPTDNSYSPYLAMLVMVAAPALVLTLYLENFANFIDLITTMAFLIAPFIALGNHLLITSKEVPAEARPAAWLQGFSWFSIVFLSAAAVGFIYSQ